MGTVEVRAVEQLEQAWEAVHEAAASLGWTVCRPSWVYYQNRWEVYAFDSRERPKVGQRSREWTAVAPTEVECLREMARCLRLIAAGETQR